MSIVHLMQDAAKKRPKTHKWIPQRFRYTRELENKALEQHQEIHIREIIERSQKEVIGEYQEMHVKYNKLTLDEAHTLFSCVVDYQRALKTLSAADPIEHRVVSIMDKYGIVMERNPVNESIPKKQKGWGMEKDASDG